MAYFSPADHQSLMLTAERGTNRDNALQLVYDKFFELHKSLHRRLRDHNYDLHPHWERASTLSNHSATFSGKTDVLALPYFRSREQAQLVERLMGRDTLDYQSTIEIYRHPIIELRLTPDCFAVELVLSPSAWWDQQNFVGKLAVQRHRETFRTILQRMDGDYCFGFWDGTQLSDMHLTTRQLVRGTYLNEWLSTFADGQDYLRIGAWYPLDDDALETNHILSELVHRVGALYSVYNFMLWTSNNDFHSFYNKISPRTAGLHHA
jgi:hypothetical protein